MLGAVLALGGGISCQQVSPGSQPTSSASFIESGGRFRFETLVSVIATHDVRSLDQLLFLLPEDLRARHVLMYESRGVQGASYANPRVILYTEDARFVVAYGGDPSLSGYWTLETMEFDERERAFRFREVSFPSEDALGSHVTFSAPNPPQCLACHGEDALPVWDTYPTWPGAYGEEDHALASVDEASGLKTFLALRASNPRYRALVGVFPELAPRDDVAAYDGKDLLSRNAEFGLLLQSLSYRVIARKVATSRRFPAFRYILLASLDPQCLDLEDFVPDAVKATFWRSARDFESKTLRANVEQAAAKRRRTHAPSDQPAPTSPETLTAFRYLVEEGLKLPTAGWTMALEKSTYDFSSPRRPTRLLERELLEAIAPSDPRARGSHDGGDHRDGYCVFLRKRSLGALTGRPGLGQQ